MKATILKGKRKGEIVTISQWCNDWFTIQEDNKVFSPTSLAFTASGMNEIIEHKNNGFLFQEYETVQAPTWTNRFLFTFKKL